MERYFFGRSILTVLVTATVGMTGCTGEEKSQSTSPVTQQTKSTQELMQELFESVLDGVQLIESSEAVDKLASEIDSSTVPPSYVVLYEGCTDGFVSGSLCVLDGVHEMDVVAPDVHIIRSVDQRYVWQDFGSVAEFQMTGQIDSIATVAVDIDAQTTAVDGIAEGELIVKGALDGNVTVDLEIRGGRNYTESAATPIEVSGRLVYQGVEYPVEGGFQRD